MVFWYTGLSGAGKRTLANALVERLDRFRVKVISIESERIPDITLESKSEKQEVDELIDLAINYQNQNYIVVVTSVSSTRALRNKARTYLGKENFLEVFVDSPLELCLNLDKYAWFERLMQEDSDLPLTERIPYEVPMAPDIHIRNCENVNMAVRMCMQARNNRLRHLAESTD